MERFSALPEDWAVQRVQAEEGSEEEMDRLSELAFSRDTAWPEEQVIVPADEVEAVQSDNTHTAA